MRLTAAPVLLALALSATAQTGPSASPATPGMATYHSDTLHFSYSYPTDYVDATAMVAPAIEASIGQNPAQAGTAKCLTVPFSRMHAGKDQGGILILVRADAACLKKKFNAKSVGELTEGEAKGLAASGAKTSFGQPVEYQLANRPASLLRGSFTLPTGQAMQAMVVCVLDQPDVACWQFLASTATAIDAMSAFPVTFDGSPATPVAPAGKP